MYIGVTGYLSTVSCGARFDGEGRVLRTDLIAGKRAINRHSVRKPIGRKLGLSPTRKRHAARFRTRKFFSYGPG